MAADLTTAVGVKTEIDAVQARIEAIRTSMAAVTGTAGTDKTIGRITVNNSQGASTYATELKALMDYLKMLIGLYNTLGGEYTEHFDADEVTDGYHISG